MPVELVDGRVRVLSVEFFAAETCNLRCAHCSASSPFLHAPSFPDLDQLEDTLESLSGVLSAGQMKILGGEPLLNPDLTRLMTVASSSGIFDRLRVTTNGVLLRRADDEFWRLADIVEVSVYPSTEKSVLRVLDQARPRADRAGTALEVKRRATFHRSIVEAPLAPRVVRRVFAACSEAHEWSCHLLHGTRFFRCSRVPTLDSYLGRLGVPHRDFTAEDGLVVDSRPTLRDELRDYLSNEVPLAACSFCLGTSGVHEPHRQLSRQEIDARLEGTALETFAESWLTGEAELASGD